MAGAGAGPSSRDIAVTPFFANGHGEQCVVPGPKKGTFESARSEFILPPGVHIITVQEVGKYASIVSVDALRATFVRGFNSSRLVTRPRVSKGGHESEWCTSDYMRFKHDIARTFRVVEAASTTEEGFDDLFDFVNDETKGMTSDTTLLSFDELMNKGNQPAYKKSNAFRRLCDLYDARIHTRHPGDPVANNRFTPISYMTDADQFFTGMDGACGLIAKDKFDTLDREFRAAMTQRYSLDELTPNILVDLYSASIFPTSSQIKAFLSSGTTQAEIATVSDETEPSYIGKALVALNRADKFKTTLKDMVDLIVKMYKPSDSNPVVLYYPLCRVFDVEPTTKAGKASLSKLEEAAKHASMEVEELGYGSSGGRRRRRTYRKKKLRNQTRKRKA